MTKARSNEGVGYVCEKNHVLVVGDSRENSKQRLEKYWQLLNKKKK